LSAAESDEQQAV